MSTVVQQVSICGDAGADVLGHGGAHHGRMMARGAASAACYEYQDDKDGDDSEQRISLPPTESARKRRQTKH